MAPHAHDADSLCLPLAGRYLERTRGRESEHGLGDILYCPAGESSIPSSSRPAER